MSGRDGSLVRLGRWLVSRVATSERNRQGLLGDLDELQVDRRDAGAGWTADVWYLKEAAVAALRLGALARTKGGGSGTEWTAELRHATRRLAKTPTFTVAAVLTLTLSVAATLAMFAVVSGVVLRPLAYPESGRLVVIEHELPGFAVEGRPARIGGYSGQYMHYAERSRELESIAGYGTFDAALTGGADAEYLRMGFVTPSLFDVLGATVSLGRPFHDDEADPSLDGHGPVVLANPLWRNRYGSAPSVVGRFIVIEGLQYEVVGVMPKEFQFPLDDVQLTRTWAQRTLVEHPDWRFDEFIARLAPGATPESARRELNALIAELPERFPSGVIPRAIEGGQMRARVTPMKEWVVDDIARTLWLMLGSVGVVFLIACTNVANLLLVRGDARRRERAIRTALGAGPGALTKLHAAEVSVLVGTATGAGTLLAAAALRVLTTVAPSQLPRMDSVGIDWSVVLLAGTLGALCVLIFCVVALGQHRTGTFPALSDGGRGQTSGRGRMMFRHTLVGSQMAMTMVLLVASGLLSRSFWTLSRVDIGFASDDVLTFQAVYPFAELQDAGPDEFYSTPFFTSLVERIEGLPGVEAVGFANCLPLVDCLSGQLMHPAPPADPDDAGEPTVIGVLQVSPGYLQALDVPSVGGRALSRRDHIDRTNAVLVSRGLARSFWPLEEAIGKTVYRGDAVPGLPAPSPYNVVGVVEDIRMVGLRRDPYPVVYAPLLLQGPAREIWNASFAVRTDVPPLALVAAIRDEVRSLRPDVAVANVQTMASIVTRATGSLRFVMWLLAVASVVALVLSVIGIYGVVAYAVSLRRSEFGIRRALGAEAGQVRNMVLGHGLLISVAGLSVGILIAAASSRLLGTLLFEVRPLDPLTYVAVFAFLVGVAALATLVPATRASRTSPREALRAD